MPLWQRPSQWVCFLKFKFCKIFINSFSAGLSIAGEGGVASSKPNAVALSGRNGLAVSAPKATAIAGVTPEEAAAYSVSLPQRNQLVIKTGSAAPKRPAFDDYEYYDLSPVRSTLTKETITSTTGSKSAVNSELLNKWKTLIAESYASPVTGAERSASGHLLRLPGNRYYAGNGFVGNRGQFSARIL